MIATAVMAVLPGPAAAHVPMVDMDGPRPVLAAAASTGNPNGPGGKREAVPPPRFHAGQPPAITAPLTRRGTLPSADFGT
jgi:hypothetical protein